MVVAVEEVVSLAHLTPAWVCHRLLARAIYNPKVRVLVAVVAVLDQVTFRVQWQVREPTLGEMVGPLVQHRNQLLRAMPSAAGVAVVVPEEQETQAHPRDQAIPLVAVQADQDKPVLPLAASTVVAVVVVELVDQLAH
jgi:hypothetical protein